jgi:type IV pilus assembly protein PilY1
VDGSPEIMDVYDPTAAAWKTILVGGLNKGGRGYYALDITDTKNPKGLWEFCWDNTVCRLSDADLGYTYGNAIITKRTVGGVTTPVVIFSSGYNNVSPGTGHGFLYVLHAITGALLDKVDTGAGSTTAPSGLAKIAAFADNFFTNNLTTYVYGGDLFGNLWRFDMSVSPPAVLLMATLKDSTGKPQSITTRPELGVINSNRVVFVGTGRYLGSSDLGDPAVQSPVLPYSYTQSLYAIKDINNTAYGNPRSALIQQTLIDNGGITRTSSTNTVNFAVNNGWYLDFNPGNTSPGERVDTDPALALGTLIVHTNVPNNNACSTGGDFFTYFFNYATGTYVSTSSGNVAGTRTYGSLVVGSNVVKTSTGAIISLDTTDQGKLKPSTAPIGGVAGAGRRVSWRELLH